jgi:hypothetical protein
MNKVCFYSTDNDSEASVERVGLTSKKQSQWPGKTEHPLSYRHYRNYMVNQVCGCFYHTTSTAGWAKTTKFAGEGYEVFESATVAFHAQKTMF